MPLAVLLLLAAGAAPGPALSTAYAPDLELTLAFADQPISGAPSPPLPTWGTEPTLSPPVSPVPPAPPVAQSQPPPLPPPLTIDQPPPGWEVPPPRSSARPPPPPPVGDVGERLLWGFGFGLGLSLDQFSESSDLSDSSTNGFFGIEIYGRMGDQFDDLWGVEAELEAGSLLVLNQVRGSFTAEVTPVDWFTFAFGPTVREDVAIACNVTNTEAVGGLIRFDFHFSPSRNPNGRSALTLGVVGDVGATVGGSEFNGSDVAYGLNLMFGWAHY